MKAQMIVSGELLSDPDLKEGAYLTLERADGRSVWRQRLRCTYLSRMTLHRFDGSAERVTYFFKPVAETEG